MEASGGKNKLASTSSNTGKADDNKVKITKIGELKVGTSNIKGRVTFKKPVSGSAFFEDTQRKYVRFTMADETGSIQIQACVPESLWPIPRIQQNKIYLMRDACVKESHPYENSDKFEIKMIDQELKIEELLDANNLNPVPWKEVKWNHLVDVIGMVCEVWPLERVKTREGERVSKRSVVVKTNELKMLRLVLWGDRAENFSEQRKCGRILVTRGARITWMDGDTFASVRSTVFINPEGIPQVEEFKRHIYSQVNHHCMLPKFEVDPLGR